MSNNGYRASVSWLLSHCSRYGSPFIRGSFTGGLAIAGQGFPVRERYILADRE